jgi:hypothetical protein
VSSWDKKGATVFAGVVVFVAIVTVFGGREKKKATEVPVETIAEPAASTRNEVQPSLTEAQMDLGAGTGAKAKREISTEPQRNSNIGNGSEQEPAKLGPIERVSSREVVNPTLDASYVGRPFPVSRSAQIDCTADRGSIDCEDQRRLDEFAQEPRDLAWAPQLENALRNLIDKRNPEFSIRNVECRLVTCVLEVASLEGHLNPNRNLQAEDWRAVHAVPFGYLIGLETDSIGRRITVTLQIYARIR